MGRHCFVPAKQLKRQMAYTGRQQQRTTRQTLNTTAPRQQQQQYGGAENNIQMVHTHGSHISQFL